jgi:hypothetical protein
MKRKKKKIAGISPLIAQASEEIVDADVSQFFEMPSFVEQSVIHARPADDYAIRLWEEPIRQLTKRKLAPEVIESDGSIDLSFVADAQQIFEVPSFVEQPVIRAHPTDDHAVRLWEELMKKPKPIKRKLTPEVIESDGSIDLSSVNMSNPYEVIGCIYCLNSKRFGVMISARLDKDFHTHMRQIELEKKRVFHNGKMPSHEEYDMMLEAFARTMSFQDYRPIGSAQTRNPVLLASLQNHIDYAVKMATGVEPKDRGHATDLVRRHLLNCPTFISEMVHSIAHTYTSSLVGNVFDQFVAAIGQHLNALELLRSEMDKLWPQYSYKNVFPRDILEVLITHLGFIEDMDSKYNIRPKFPVPFGM